MNSGKKILISRRVSSRKTPETASAAKHGLRKHLTVLLPILFRAALAISFLPHVDFDYDFLSLAVVGLPLIAPAQARIQNFEMGGEFL